ncbi:hypothetical protein [Paenibacillus alkalitolerans]|uniref:hypothetical protein n=1 Tax=Paenibacillus alkalitolerans TaxID=2799335 RepID=UPI0018F2FA7C|nr:hypothetical protein [Paenibacillus alkalitolerans]
MMKNNKIQLGLLAIIAVWFVASITMSLVGLFDQPGEPPVYFGLFLGGSIMSFLLVYAISRSMREALFAIPLWLIVAMHLLRIVGIFFIIDALTGMLPPLFGWPAGIGDIVAAIISVPLVIALKRRTPFKTAS